MADARALRAEADKQMARKNYRRAEKLYRELVQRSPGDPLLRVRHAELLRRLCDDGMAARAYCKATELFVAAGKEAQAKAAWALASSLDPSLPYPVAVAPQRKRAAPVEEVTFEAAAIAPPPPAPRLALPDLMPENEFDDIYVKGGEELAATG